MKRKHILCLIISVFLIFLLFFSPKISGFVIQAGNATQADAEEAISHAKQDIEEMRSANFTILYASDTLEVAQKAFTSGDYVRAVSLCEGISELKKMAFDIRERLTALYLNLDNYESKGYNMSRALELHSEAVEDFYSERYSDAEKKIEEAYKLAEMEREKRSFIRKIKTASKSFVQKYWIYILIAILVLVLTIWIGYRFINIRYLKYKIHNLRAEQRGIDNLIKRAQADRFKNGKLSESEYEIKLEKYSSRREEIKRKLPILENRLRKLESRGFFGVFRKK